MTEPYPLIAARRAAHLPVEGGHQIYFEDSGNEDGLPVVFLHGGPGAGCKPGHRQFFHPERYRCVLFDQRGAGRSTPFGGTDNNTLPLLIDDMEALRRHLEIDRWVVFGGSWGATLALAYAEAHPERVAGMILRGTFLARARDVAWFFEDGASRVLPQAWARFVETVGEPVTGVGMVEHLHQLAFGADRAEAERIARAWEAWSGEVVMYSFDTAPGQGSNAESSGQSDNRNADRDATKGSDLTVALAKTRIELHYARYAYFMRDNQLLEDSARLPDVPVHIIHGQRDLTCLPEAAYAVHKAIPGSTLEILRTGGHLSGEQPMAGSLQRAADDMAARLSGAASSPGGRA